MNNIQALIQQYCPDGIEFKELEKVVTLTMGTSPSGNTFSSNPDDGIEFHQGKTFFSNEIIKQSDVYTTNPIKIAEPNSLIMSVRAPVGATNITDRKIAIGRGLCSMVGKEGLLTRFLYYFINDNIQTLKNKSKGSTFEAINTDDIKQIKIPVPPIFIQKEIVNILDEYTFLEEELKMKLEAELEARKKQYEFYRNKLLTFTPPHLTNVNSVIYKTLEEIANIKNGKDWKKLEKGNIPVYGTGGIMGYVNTYVYRKPTVLIPRKGSITNIFYLDKPFWNVDTIYYTVIDEDQIIPKFFYYYMKVVNLEKLDTGSGRPSLTQAILNKIIIPIPSLSEQERIVNILDKFDALVNDISKGLPAEINARRKQYEYYRNRLLDFKPLSA